MNPHGVNRVLISKAIVFENMEHFCLQNSELKWTGSLCDFKVFVLTEIDKETAKNATWRSPSGGTWTSKAICYRYLGIRKVRIYTLREETAKI
jgi:hypothetical protein